MPLQSLEKYLLNNLVSQIDHSLLRKLNDYLFHGKSLDIIISEYSNKVNSNEYSDAEKIKNGKMFYDHLRHELDQIHKSSNDLIELIVEYLFEVKNEEIEKFINFLQEELKTTRLN